MQHVRVQPVHGTLELPAIQFPLAELATREQKRKVGSEAYFRIVEILIAIWEPATNGPDGRKNDRTCLRNVHVAFWEIMLPFLVLFRGLKKLEPRPFQYSLGVKTKIPDEHPRPFHMGVWESPPPPHPVRNEIRLKCNPELQSTSTCFFMNCTQSLSFLLVVETLQWAR